MNPRGRCDVVTLTAVATVIIGFVVAGIPQLLTEDERKKGGVGRPRLYTIHFSVQNRPAAKYILRVKCESLSGLRSREFRIRRTVSAVWRRVQG